MKKQSIFPTPTVAMTGARFKIESPHLIWKDPDAFPKLLKFGVRDDLEGRGLQNVQVNIISSKKFFLKAQPLIVKSAPTYWSRSSLGR